MRRGKYGGHADDGLRLVDCRITNAVRCVPPENKPLAEEIAACRRFLAAEIGGLKMLRVLVALGAVTHTSVVDTLCLKRGTYPFRHGALHALPGGRFLADSYHCSRQNTNTGRLTPTMFEDVFRKALAIFSEPSS